MAHICNPIIGDSKAGDVCEFQSNRPIQYTLCQSRMHSKTLSKITKNKKEIMSVQTISSFHMEYLVSAVI